MLLGYIRYPLSSPRYSLPVAETTRFSLFNWSDGNYTWSWTPPLFQSGGQARPFILGIRAYAFVIGSVNRRGHLYYTYVLFKGKVGIKPTLLNLSSPNPINWVKYITMSARGGIEPPNHFSDLLTPHPGYYMSLQPQCFSVAFLRPVHNRLLSR